MSGGKKHRRKRKQPESVNAEELLKLEKRKENKKYLLPLALNSVVFLIAYWFFMSQPFYKTVLWIYFALTLGSTLTYVVYNRAFTRKGVTPEMLPSSMSEEEKTEFIADGERRLKRSKWMLTIIFPLILTFFIDMFVLFVAEPLLSGFNF